MITFSGLLQLMDELKVPYIRVFDIYNNLLFQFTNSDSIDATKKQLQAMMPAFQHYNKIQVHGCDKRMFAGNWRGCYKWTVSTSDENAKQVGQAGAGVPTNWQMIPNGFIPQSMMEMQMKHMKDLYGLQLEIEKMKGAQKNKFDFLPPVEYMPFIGKFLGWSPNEMKELAGMGINTKIAGQPEVFQTKQFKDVAEMTTDEKNKRIEELMQALTEKVDAEHMILLLELLYKRPELAAKAIKAANSGLF